MKLNAFVLGLVCFACGVAVAAPRKPKAPKPLWPVANPGFLQGNFTPSTNQRLISGIFGPRLKWGDGRYDHHEGFDFYAFFDEAHPRGDHPVTCILDGVVTDIIDPPNPERTETGRKVVVTHAVPWSAYGAPREWGPVKSGYLHLSAIRVQKGQKLEAGDLVGEAGESGYTSTVHLHLNLYRAGGRDVNVNPARVFQPKLYPQAVTPLSKQTVEVQWLERDVEGGTAVARVLLPYNAYTLDGFVFEVDKDTRRAISFEYVSAEQRDKRDTGDVDLFPGLRLYPLRFNGGGTLEANNARSVPRGWPLARHPIRGGGVRLGFDLEARDVPKDAKSFAITVHGVGGERVTVKARGFEASR
ncbi:MAG: M23 family metallopeptidase [Planctomycetes bacterium]|nr:M23 family metallopeptidase [Planctomycetota bacterium]